MTDTTTKRGPAPSSPVWFSPYDYALHEDPYPTYARMREEAPVYRNDELDFFALSRHADVLAAFRDPAHFSNRNGVTLDPVAYGPHAHKSMSFLAMDPPVHTRMRLLVSKGFTPKRIADLEPRIREIAKSHVAPAVEKQSFDMVKEVAGRLPMDVISEMLGVPDSDRAELRRLADLVLHRAEGTSDIPPEGMEAALNLAGYFSEMVAARRVNPTEDLTTALMSAEIDGDKLVEDEIVSFLFLMVVAGNETTTKLISNAWYWAWLNPGERAKPLGDPTRINDWVEETLRYDTSTQMLVRVTDGTVELHDTVIPEDSKVLLLIGSANRDPRVFSDAERYELDRDTAQLISFGSGRHFCLGAALARMEARVCLDELVAKVSDFEVDPDGCERVHSSNVRGFAAMPTTVKRR
jgi:cytochrome P450